MLMDANYYIALFNEFALKVESSQENRKTRFTKEFMKTSGISDPKAPIVEMFSVFIAGIEKGVELTLQLLSENHKNNAAIKK